MQFEVTGKETHEGRMVMVRADTGEPMLLQAAVRDSRAPARSKMLLGFGRTTGKPTIPMGELKLDLN